MRLLKFRFCRYKGFPQKSKRSPPGLNREAIDPRNNREDLTLDLKRLAVLLTGQGVRTAMLQTAIGAGLLPDPDERRARRTHSLTEDSASATETVTPHAGPPFAHQRTAASLASKLNQLRSRTNLAGLK